MNLLVKLKGLHAVGWGNVFRSFSYGLRRDRAERRFGRPRASGPEQGPGALHSFAAAPDGLDLLFAEATLELRFLAADFVRITWQPGQLPAGYGLAEGGWRPPQVTVAPSAEGWLLTTDRLRLEVSPQGGLRILGPAGQLIREDLPPTRQGERWRLRSPLPPEERVMGTGERAMPLNLRGRTVRNWNREPKGAYSPGDDPIYIGVPLWLGLHDGGSYLLFHENSWESTFAFGSDGALCTFAGGALRYYVAVGSPAELLERYSRLTGRPALPPRWALGYHQARWSYMDEQEVREVVAGFERHGLPLSALHLDIHYMDGYRVFTVDPARFPDLGALAAELAGKGIALVTIIDPGVKVDEGYRLYREGVEGEHFCRLPDGEVATGPVWPGECAFPDFTRPATRRWWGEQYRFLVEQGVTGIWHDMNEVAVFAPWGEPTLPRTVRHDFDGRGGDHEEGHNQYALLEARAAFEGLRELAPERRPWILSRSGWAGLQRYAWSWTGDSESNWWTLRQSVRIALSLGLSGIPYSGPDIGGFGGSPGPELFVRWFQAASLLPFFRTHCALFAPRREPWLFGDQATACVRQALQLRYRLMPYLYTLAWRSSQSGEPLVRPMFWHWPEDRRLWDLDDQFMVGEALLAAPVMEEGATSRKVVLPEGFWIDLAGGQAWSGGQTIDLPVTLESLPLLVRCGSLVPMADQGGGLTLHLFLSCAAACRPVFAECGVLYTDGGDGYGSGRVDRFELKAAKGRFKLRRRSEGDGFPLPPLALQVHGTAVRSLLVDGRELKGADGLFPAPGAFELVVVEV